MEKSYENGRRLEMNFGNIGVIMNFAAAAADGLKMELPISRNSFGPGSKQPASKLNEQRMTFSVVNLAEIY